MQIRTNPCFPWITSLLKKCSTQSHLQQFHAQIVRKGLDQDHFLISQFIVSLSKTLSGLNYSTQVFNTVLRPNTCLYNVLVKTFIDNSRFSEAISVFVRMKRENCFADEYTYPLLVKLCASEIRVREGMAFHGSSLRCGVDSDVFVRTSLIDFYGKCKDVESARRLFDEMPKRNVVSWTAMVVGYVSSGDLKEAKKLFDEMPKRNSIAWTAMIDGFMKSNDVINARKLFDEMPEREKNLVSFTVMIDGYAKIGELEKAKDLFFEKAPKKRDLASYCSMIHGLSIHGRGREAIDLFDSMVEKGGLVPDEKAFTVILSACSRDGFVSEGLNYFESLTKRFSIVPSPYHYSCLIDLLGRSGHLREGYEILRSKPIEPFYEAWCALLGACKLHSETELGELIGARILNAEPRRCGNYVLLSQIYAERERWSDVTLVQDRMVEKGVQKLPGCSWVNSEE